MKPKVGQREAKALWVPLQSYSTVNYPSAAPAVTDGDIPESEGTAM